MKANRDVSSAARARIQAKINEAPVKRVGPAPKKPSARLDLVLNYVAAARPAADVHAYERAIEKNDLLTIKYFWDGLRAARSVGKISIPAMPPDKGSVATGFLIAPGLLMTNWHVFDSDSKQYTHSQVASRARVQFAFELDQKGEERQTTWFKLRPDQFLLESEELDYAVVAVDPASQEGPETLESFGWLRLNKQLGKTDYGDFLSIIQHPKGETKHIAIRENELLPFEEDEDFLTYRSDTFRGSSGSPVFNDFWDVVALHHEGVPATDSQGRWLGHDDQPLPPNPDEEDVKWIANEGARVSRIVNSINAGAPAGRYRDDLLATFAGTLKPAGGDPGGLDLASRGGAEREAMPYADLPAKDRVTVLAPLNTLIRVESIPAIALVRPAPPSPAIITPSDARPQRALEKLNFDPDYSNRQGYSASFLGRDRKVPMPTLTKEGEDQLAPLKKGSKKVLHYHHYSLMMHAKRRMPMLAACNVDYRSAQRDDLSRKAYGSDQWVIDERMEDEYQIPKGFYDRWKRIEYGHVIAREDSCWGASDDEREAANADTFHLTNCTPQHERFNKAPGRWRKLEAAITRQGEADRVINRMCVFAGPVFRRKGDWPLKDGIDDILAPLSFWKVLVAPTKGGGLMTYGFILGQKKELQASQPTVTEDFDPGEFSDEQKTLEEIEAVTDVRFAASLKAVDVMKSHPDGKESLTLASPEEVWTGRR